MEITIAADDKYQSNWRYPRMAMMVRLSE